MTVHHIALLFENFWPKDFDLNIFAILLRPRLRDLTSTVARALSSHLQPNISPIFSADWIGEQHDSSSRRAFVTANVFSEIYNPNPSTFIDFNRQSPKFISSSIQFNPPWAYLGFCFW